MEIKIKHHPAHEQTAQEINAVLTKNGIASTVEKNGKDVYITIAKKEEKVAPALGSSFVYFDSVPGY
jgi:uncharacterized protein (DUF111 family)